MNAKINEIRSAIKNHLYNCALALALTLPDICAKVEYGDSVSNKGKKYQQWFDTFAVSKFTVTATKLPSNEHVPYVWLTAEECWKLRCAVLHAGNFELNCEQSKLRRLFIHVHEKNGKNYDWRDGKYADFDLILMCHNLCDAAEEYYNNHPNKELFNIGEIEICT